MSDLEADFKDLQKFQAANQKRIAAMKSGGAAGYALRYGLLALQRYAMIVTHVASGTLKASHRVEIDMPSLYGRIYIDPSAKNPWTGERAAIYGPYEHARGGSHAFYARTIQEHGPTVVADMFDLIEKEL